jgi:hypothetical protein
MNSEKSLIFRCFNFGNDRDKIKRILVIIAKSCFMAFIL